MNNYITWESLKCPPKQLECILEKLICNLQCKPETTFTGSFAGGVLTLNVNGVAASITLPDLDNQSLSLSGNILTISNGNTIDLTPFANIADVVTTITNNGDGTATYVNEAGTSVTFPIGSATLINNGDGTYTFTAADGSTVTISDTSLSSLVDNGDGSFTYTNEAGTITTFTVADDIVTTITDTIAGNKIATYTNELGATVDINETISTIVNNGDGTFTYTDEAGVSTTFTEGVAETAFAGTSADGSITITPSGVAGHTSDFSVNFPAPVADILTTVTNTVIGNKIADYTDEVGTVTSINETVTSLGIPTLAAGNILTIPFVNEAGVTQTVTVDLSGLITVDVQLDTATYDAASNIITLLETNGDTHTVNLSEFSIVTTTNPDGSITVTQEGVTKFTIPVPQPAAVVTNNAAPYSFNPTTQTLNIPQVPSIVNGQLVQGDGTTPEEIPDFWRVGLGATGALPDGTTDVTEKIGHQSDIYVGADALVTVGHGGGDIANNTALGNFALDANTSGTENTAIGNTSLQSNTSGAANVAIGNRSLLRNTIGLGNVAIGRESMLNNTTGVNNTSIGFNSLRANTTGIFNSSLGSSSLFSNTTGNFNTAIGFNSLFYNGSGLSNTANGYYSLFSNTTGTYNTSVGTESLQFNTIGNYNTAIGEIALTSNINGLNNTASGSNSLSSNTTGNNNTSNGRNSLQFTTNNNQNTAIGVESFNHYDILVTGAIITASTSTQVTISPALTGGWTIGDDIVMDIIAPFSNSIPGFYPGVYKIVNATTLEVLKPNTILGTTGNVNNVKVIQGRKINNATALGYDAEPTASNQVMLGNTAVTEVRTSGAYFGTAFNIVSDKRNKYVGDVLATKELYGNKINIYEYQLISDGTWHIGVIAQDVREIEEKRGKFILTSESEGVNYGATVEAFNKELGTDYKFFSGINKDAEIIKEQLLQKQGITKEEAAKLKEIYETIVRESQEYILDEEGKPSDKIKYDGRFDKEVKKYKGKEIDADKLYNNLIVIEKDMLSLSTTINMLL